MSLANQDNIPLYLVSLSGGGYRAALYHAGVLRALHMHHGFYPDPPQGLGPPVTYISAVSGGALPASLWNVALSRQGLTDMGESWPERKLLDLIGRTPSLGGRLNWLIRRVSLQTSWRSFVAEWWRDALQDASRRPSSLGRSAVGVHAYDPGLDHRYDPPGVVSSRS